jgi:hypothetical protein
MLHEDVSFLFAQRDAAAFVEKSFVRGVGVGAAVQSFDNLPELIATLFGYRVLK